MNPKFDLEGFYVALDGHRKTQGITWKGVAEKTGVAASTLTRMRQGRSPDAAGLVALAKWSGLDAVDFYRDELLDTGSPASLAQMTTILRADKNLSKESVVALENMLTSAYETLRSREDET